MPNMPGVAQTCLHRNICRRQLAQQQLQLLNALSSLTRYQNSWQPCHFFKVLCCCSCLADFVGLVCNQKSWLVCESSSIQLQLVLHHIIQLKVCVVQIMQSFQMITHWGGGQGGGDGNLLTRNHECRQHAKHQEQNAMSAVIHSVIISYMPAT